MKTPMNEPITIFKKQFNFLSIAVRRAGHQEPPDRDSLRLGQGDAARVLEDGGQAHLCPLCREEIRCDGVRHAPELPLRRRHFFITGALVKRLNKSNAKLKLFFDAIEDKENMIQFNEYSGDREMNALSRSLNRINELLATAKSDSQKQEKFYYSLLEEIPSGIIAYRDLRLRCL